MAIPGGPEAIDAAWMADVLGQPVDEVTLTPLGVGVGLLSDLLVADVAGPGGRRRVVVKLASSSPAARALADGYRFYEREVAVYAVLAGAVGLGLPEVHLAEIDRHSASFALVLEDLSGLRTADQLAGCTPEDAVRVVRDLARHHAASWGAGPGELAGLDSFSSPPYPGFHADAMAASWAAGRHGVLAGLAPRFLVLGDGWAETGPALMARLGQRPATLTHGDLRLDNLFFPSTGPVVAVDWQLACPWPGAVDLACFAVMSLAVDVRRAILDDLVTEYHATLIASGVDGYGRDELDGDLALAALFWFCSPITVGGLDLATPRERDLAHALVERTTAAIDDLCALDHLS